MSLLTLLRPAPPKAPGRHTPAWLGLQQALAEVQERANGFQADIEQLKQRHARERAGWQQALELAAAESRGIAAERDEARARSDANRDGWLRADDEVKRLRAILDASTGEPGIDVPAPIEQGCRDTPHTAAETVRDVGLLDMAETGEHGLVADMLAGLRQDRGPKPPLPTDPPPPVTAVTPVLPLGTRSVAVRLVKPAPPVEASPVSGQRARDSVQDALTH